jgi:hypothetical protein
MATWQAYAYTVQAPDGVKGKKQMDFITFRERGTAVTPCVVANANKDCVPPLFVFSRKVSRPIYSRWPVGYTGGRK